MTTDVPVYHVCVLEGDVSVSVPKTGRGDRVVIVDTITDHGRVTRTHVNGEVQPCVKIWVFCLLLGR